MSRPPPSASLAVAGEKRKHREDESDIDARCRSGHSVFVGNLDARTNEYQLVQLFKPFGTLLRVDYMWHKAGPRRGTPRGYAFVEYEKADSTTRAIASLNGTVINGKPLSVHLSTDEAVAQAAAAAAVHGTATGNGGVAGARALAKQREREREFLTPEEERSRRSAQGSGATIAAAAVALTNESVIDDRVAAIRAQLTRLRDEKSVSSAGTLTSKASLSRKP